MEVGVIIMNYETRNGLRRSWVAIGGAIAALALGVHFLEDIGSNHSPQQPPIETTVPPGSTEVPFITVD